MGKLLYTPVEGCRMLGVGRSKVYELLGTGELTSVRIGACRRIPARPLLEFVNRLSAGAGGSPDRRRCQSFGRDALEPA